MFDLCTKKPLRTGNLNKRFADLCRQKNRHWAGTQQRIVYYVTAMITNYTPPPETPVDVAPPPGSARRSLRKIQWKVVVTRKYNPARAILVFGNNEFEAIADAQKTMRQTYGIFDATGFSVPVRV